MEWLQQEKPRKRDKGWLYILVSGTHLGWGYDSCSKRVFNNLASVRGIYYFKTSCQHTLSPAVWRSGVRMKTCWLGAFSLTWTKSFVVGPKQPTGTKVHSHGCLWFQWMAIFCKWKAVVPRSIQGVQNFDLMELEFNFGPNDQKDNLTQPAAIRPCYCLSITTHCISLPKMTHFCSVLQQNIWLVGTRSK